MTPRRQAAVRFVMVCRSGQDHRPLVYVMAGGEPEKGDEGAKAAAAGLDKTSGCGVHTWRRIELR